MIEILRGAVANGERVVVESDIYTGIAGVQRRGDAIELAYLGAPPGLGQPMPFPLTIKSAVAGSIEARATGYRMGLNDRRGARMTVLTVEVAPLAPD